jgi:hypothetical protein
MRGMRGITGQLYVAVACLLMLAMLAPLLIHLFVVVAPLVVIVGLVAIVVRLVWFYTNRY